jgi:hypothetical protein
MSDRTFVVVGYAALRGSHGLHAGGPFRDQREAEDYIRDVPGRQRFKYRLTWEAVPLSDPDIQRPRSGDVLI